MGDKCTFGTRAPIDVNMLNEIIYRETKNFRNYKNYRPDFGAIPVTSKFYAKHHQVKEGSEAETKKIKAYQQSVAQARALGPHSKFAFPTITSHEYGWYTKPLVKIDRNDKRFYRPKQESNETKVEVLIKMATLKKK